MEIQGEVMITPLIQMQHYYSWNNHNCKQNKGLLKVIRNVIVL